MLDLLVMHQAEFTLSYYSLNLTVITMKSSPADLLYSCLRALIHFLTNSLHRLDRTALADFSVVTALL
jgi:hypothetical protein